MKIIFVSDTKLGKDTTNILNFCFSKKFTFIFPSHHIYASRKQSLPLTNSTYLVFLLPGMQRRLYRSKYACFYSEKKNQKKPDKVAAVKNISSTVYVICTTCFDECSLLHVITGRYYFSKKSIVSLRLFWLSCYRFLWRKHFERSLYFVCYVHNNSIMLMPKFENKTVIYYTS